MMDASGNTFRCIDTSQEIVMTDFDDDRDTEFDADDRAFDRRIMEYKPMIQSIIGRLNVRFDQDDYMQVGRTFNRPMMLWIIGSYSMMRRSNARSSASNS